jgi:hypothetical protein
MIAGLALVAFRVFDDFPGPGGDYTVDQASVERAVEHPCARMRAASRRIVLMSTPEEGAASLRAFTESVGAIVSAIEDAGPDPDSRAWRDDWIALTDSLDEYADQLEAGDAKYLAPRDTSGAPITARMYYGSPTGCEVPVVIDALDPVAAASFWEY